jgi:hypothetical protein
MVHRHISTQGSVPNSTQCFLENGLDVWDLLHDVRSDTVRFLKDAVNVLLMPTALRILQQRIKRLQTSCAEICRDECVKNWQSLGTSAGQQRDLITDSYRQGRNIFFISCTWFHVFAARYNFMACIGTTLNYNLETQCCLLAFCESPGFKTAHSTFHVFFNIL